DVQIGIDGSVTGSASLTGVPVFGQPVDFTGTVSAPANGPLQGSFTADIAGPVALGGGASISAVHVTLSGSGLSVTGAVKVGGNTGPVVLVSGSYTDAQTWSLNAASTATNWTPVAGVTINAVFTGAVSSVNGVVSFGLTADAQAPIVLSDQV